MKVNQKDESKSMSAQESIPFERMFQDGICRVREGYYTKTIEFQDINYTLAQQEDKTAIFEEWCSFLNFFNGCFCVSQTIFPFLLFNHLLGFDSKFLE